MSPCGHHRISARKTMDCRRGGLVEENNETCYKSYSPARACLATSDGGFGRQNALNPDEQDRIVRSSSGGTVTYYTAPVPVVWQYDNMAWTIALWIAREKESRFRSKLGWIGRVYFGRARLVVSKNGKVRIWSMCGRTRCVRGPLHCGQNRQQRGKPFSDAKSDVEIFPSSVLTHPPLRATVMDTFRERESWAIHPNMLSMRW